MRPRHLRRAALLALLLLGYGAGPAHAAEPAPAPSAPAPSTPPPSAGPSSTPALDTESLPLPSDVPFEWSAPEGCPSRTEVLSGLVQLLEADVTSWDRFESVRGNITRGEGVFQLELQFIRGRRIERRSFATRDCADLSHAAAVALALVLDPAWDWGDKAPAPEIGAIKPPVPSEADPGAPIAKPSAEAEVTFEIGPEGVIDATTLGRSAFGLGLLARARTSLAGARLSADLFGTWLPGQTIDVRPAESVVLGLAAAGVRGCSWPTLVLGLCAEIEAGRLSASGIGENAGQETLDTWIAPGGSVILQTGLVPGLLLSSRVSVLAPLTRPRYFVNQTEGVHEVPGAAVRVALGLILTEK